LRRVGKGARATCQPSGVKIVKNVLFPPVCTHGGGLGWGYWELKSE